MRRRFFRYTAVFLSLLITVFAAACSAEDVTPEPPEEKDDKIMIGMSFDSFVIERWLTDRNVFISTV